MDKLMERAVVRSQKSIAGGIYDMWLEAPGIAARALAGQFVDVYCDDNSRLLPRPISICQTDKDKGHIRLVYRVAGKGTAAFSGLAPGDAIDVLGPLGNGFLAASGMPRAEDRIMLIGGGIGIPPMLGLAASLRAGLPGDGSKVDIVLGYRDEVFLLEDFSGLGSVYTAVEDGHRGVKGTVLDAIEEYGIKADVIYACGPAPMLRAIKAYAAASSVTAWVSMEERMACGVGACLGCVVRTEHTDAHSNVRNRRVCADGPVFNASEVII